MATYIQLVVPQQPQTTDQPLMGTSVLWVVGLAELAELAGLAKLAASPLDRKRPRVESSRNPVSEVKKVKN